MPGVIFPRVDAAALRLIPELRLRRALESRPLAAPGRAPLVCRLRGRARQRLGLDRGLLAVLVRRVADATTLRDSSMRLVHLHAACRAGVQPGDEAIAEVLRRRDADSAVIAVRRQLMGEGRSLGIGPSDADALVRGDTIASARARAIARRDAARRRAEQLPLFPGRGSSSSATWVGTDPIDPAARLAAGDPGLVETLTLALVLVLE